MTDDKQLNKNNTILDLYLKYHETYKQKYGERTAVLCQVGDFFEIYAIINETEEIGPNIYKLADMMGIQVTRRNKSNTEVNRSNYLMSGFPLAGIQKHIQTLVANCYTVIVIRQITPPPNVRRDVTEIVSPSMTLSPSSADANHIIVLMFHYENTRWICGMAAADISTGSSMIYQISSTIEDPLYAFDEITRIFHTYPTKEIVLLCSKTAYPHREFIMTTLGLHQRIIGIHPLWDQYANASCYNKKDYQEAILSKAGIGNGMLSNHIITGMDDMSQGVIALCYLIQFAYEHNPKLIEKLQTPKRLLQENRLTLQYNSAVQLNIISSGSPNEMPLLSLLNRTVTAFGGRLFRDRFLNPIMNSAVLQERYREIAFYSNDQLYQKVRKHLTGILDLERISRRMTAETYHPCDWSSFHTSLTAIVSIATLLEKPELHTTTFHIMRSYDTILNLEEASKYLLSDIRGNIFTLGIYPDLDEIAATITTNVQVLTDIVKFLSNLGGTGAGDTTLCKLDCNERDGYFLSTTKKRWDIIRSRLSPEILKEYQTKPISSISNTLRVTSTKIDTASDMIIKSQAKIASITEEKYISFLRSFMEQNASLLQEITNEIAHIDVQTTNAMNAYEYRYVCPTLVTPTPTDTSSGIEMKQLRHPIIERIQQKIDYVANDISLNSSSPESGLLLYGVNASGKSSLMKAIGLAIIMAQSGMYVPCSEMKFTPYHSIFTRISGNDNIYQGMSSFAVEMTELKHILLRADDRSLVLGDELCAGTEAVSALSIVTAGIDMLLKKKATFVFATHLHELLQIPEIKTHVEQEAIQVAHMHTEVNDGKIIYDRTLRSGSGADTYGIEVCRGLGMPQEFMYFAEKIRKHVTQANTSFVSAKQSRYNTSIKMDLCGVCKKSKAMETHHIRYQQDATPDGFIKDVPIHKNQASNLVPLCHQCHLQEHHGSLLIRGWKQTTNGVELDYLYVDDLDLSSEKDQKEENKKQIDVLEQAHIWKPYVRYTRRGWMFRKSLSQRSKFKEITEEKLIEAMRKITAIPSYLAPSSLHDLDQLQTCLLDVTL